MSAEAARVTVATLRAKHAAAERIVMVTAADFSLARIVDDAGVDVVLVGDSLGQVALGYDSTLPVTMEEMLVFTRAVARGARRALVVGDMPFLSYQVSAEEARRNAGRFLKEGGAAAVKLEGGAEVAATVASIVAMGVPVMGHVGLTPQSVHAMGGYRVQGRDEEQARAILEGARALEQAGAFAVVLEGVPRALAARVSAALGIPTIGIGAGPGCGGQVLVLHDLLGLWAGHRPKFAKRYAACGEEAGRAVRQFCADVRGGLFPDEEHSFD
ncbi:MAG TPA: 3-methyl-2-oxobutanoate hydroxymethyltransferase [Candidatus Methanoperedens sp.]|nr:3-methyl-2-oxobutanoate hydroxymethyltransferase [Candidatus Methanoperedens sp.]